MTRPVYPGIELRLLRYVVAVAEELHFSRAALRVHVAQPSLSKQIRELEEGIGVRLFDRTNRQVQLTQAGRVFTKEAVKALAHSDRAVRLARQADPTDNGSLQVGYTPRMNLRLLSGIRRLSLDHRRAFTLSFHSSSTHDQVQSLIQGTLQAGFVTLPVRNESLAVRSLVREPLVVVVPQSHPLAANRELHTTDMCHLPVISRARRLNPTSYDHLQKLFKKAGYKPKVVQEVMTEAEALHMVREGLGVFFMKVSAIPLEPNGIAYARVSDASIFEETGFAYRRDNRSTRLQEFVLLLRSHSRELVRLSLLHGAEALPHQYPDPRQLEMF